MDEMQAVRELLPDPPSPTPHVTAAAWGRLSDATRAERGTTGRRSRPTPPRTRLRPWWPPAVGLGLTACAATVAIAAVSLVPGGTPGGGSSASRTPTAQPPASVVSAESVLLAAAERTAGAEQNSGLYWHVRAVRGSAYVGGPADDRYVMERRVAEASWTHRSPDGRDYGSEQGLGIRPATSADEAAWRRDGSPTRMRLESPVRCPDRQSPCAKEVFMTTTTTTEPGPVRGSWSKKYQGKIGAIGDHNVSLREIMNLPGQPTALKQHLLQYYEGHDTELASEPMSAEMWLFTVTPPLLAQWPASPEVRAAAYRMLAGLDSVRSLGTVTDPLGRTGVGVAPERRAAGGTHERQLIIDPTTGSLLAEQVVLTEPGGSTASMKPGTRTNYVAYQDVRWTDEAP